MTPESDPMLRDFFHWLKNPVHFAAVLTSLIPIYFVTAFMEFYGRRIPVYDQWIRSNFMVIDAQNGTLSFMDIWASHNGHRIIFSNLITVILGRFSHWNPKLEMWVNLPLGLIVVALLAYIAWQHRAVFPLLLVTITTLYFSMVQDFNWITAFQSQWHLVIIFFLLALILIMQTAPRAWVVVVAAVLSFCALFSSGNGVVGWVIIPAVLWVYGYRRWWHYAIWGGLGAISLYLYLRDDPVMAFSTMQATRPVGYTDPLLLLRFLIYFLGAPFASRREDFALLMGSVGLVALGLNLFYLWQSRAFTLRQITPWLAIAANGLIGGLVIGVGRLENQPERLWQALVTRYTGTASLFWIGLACLMILIGASLWQAQAGRWLLYSNLVVGGLIALFYVQANIWILQNNTYFYNVGLFFPRPEYYQEETCILDMPLYREMECAAFHPILLQDLEVLYMTAAYQLAIFAEEAQVNVLPETYAPGSPILLHTDSRWLNVYMREFLLHDIPESDLSHVAPPERYESVATFPDPPQPMYETLSEETLDALAATLIGRDQIWLVTIPEVDNTAFFARLEAAGYLATPYPIQHPRYRTAKFSLYRFQRPPETLTPLWRYGEEGITLLSWTVNADAPLLPCENVYLQTWWRTDDVPLLNYSTSLVLVDAAGNSRAQKDAAIGDTLMQLWQPGQLYFDERILTVPCDAAPGTYTLTLSIYHHISETNTFDLLPAEDAAGEDLGQRPVLTTLDIE